MLGFLLISLRAPVWYDEANYLTLARSIRDTGYPIWFWVPDRPQLFVNSPPVLLYFIAFLTKWVSSDVVTLRIVFAALFGLAPLLLLASRAPKNGGSLFAVAIAATFAACSGFFLMELIQLRMDLALAGESCIAVMLFVAATCPAQTDRPLVALVLLFGISALAIVTKYQAVCLTAALVVDAALAWFLSGRRSVPWAALFAHLAGVATGLVVLSLWASHSDVGAGTAALSGAVNANIFDRILPRGHLAGEVVTLANVAKRVVAMTAIPLTMVAIASALGRIDWRENLLRLFVVLAAVVAAFNLAVYRLPGAGDFYLVQAAIPLGYVLGRSIESLLGLSRSCAAVRVLAPVLIAHAVLNVPPVTRAIQPKVDRAIAEEIAPSLHPDDVLLLGDETQSRAIPYWLQRHDRYGYLFYMGAAEAADLLQRDGAGKVAAMVLPDGSSAKLMTPEWSKAAAVIEREFSLMPQTADTHGQQVYLRRSGGDVSNGRAAN